jgi:glycosyltransferase involved in cell wall biosynthesis
MKQKVLFFIIAMNLFLLSEGVCEAPRICLNMIVKNESHVIERCLESVKPLIDYWVIVDTGSEDKTQEIIKKMMQGIPGELHERAWINFEHNRNEALALAKDKADYLFFIDADDILSLGKDFKKADLDRDFYFVRLKIKELFYDRIQLVKSSFDWKWVGVVHEIIECAEAKTSANLEGAFIQILGGGARSCDPLKYMKDALLLETSIKKRLDTPRDMFYLGRSYLGAGMPEMALRAFTKRAKMGGWNEEVFWSLYHIALLQESLNKPEAEISKHFLNAYQYMPTYLEPLYQLANYYRRTERYFLGYLISSFALNRNTPPSDFLFLESWIYDYGLLFEYFVCSYWTGHYNESYAACQQLLAKAKLPSEMQELVEKNKVILEKKLEDLKNQPQAILLPLES